MFHPFYSGYPYSRHCGFSMFDSMAFMPFCRRDFYRDCRYDYNHYADPFYGWYGHQHW